VPIGEILRIKTEIGIGFIRQAGVVQEILFHSGSLLEGTFDQLSEGQKVEFDHKPYGPSGGKIRAANIRLIRPTN
jgi:cold shock CspA family protein